MSSPSPTPQQLNNYAAQSILNSAQRCVNPIYSQTIVPANQPTVNVVLNNAGLQRGIWIKVVAVLANTSGGAAATLSAIGAPNILTNIQFSDYSNYQRVNTTGMHVYAVECLKRKLVMGAAYTTDQTKFGANWSPITAPASIANAANGTVIMYYHIPIAYLDNDFRGAIWGGVTSASMNLTFTFNPTPGMATGGGIDTTNAVYTGTNAVAITSATVTVYQEYYDQIPRSSTGLLLPLIDMQTMCELKWSPFPNIPAGAETLLPYTNQRAYLSTLVYYNNFPNPALGTDMTAIRSIAANTYQAWKLDPLTATLFNRLNMGDDFPPGFYAFDTRSKPITTVQWGNTAIGITPITANAGAYCNVYYENFAQVSTIGGAQSQIG